jgi:hypothetical protein
MHLVTTNNVVQTALLYEVSFPVNFELYRHYKVYYWNINWKGTTNSMQFNLRSTSEYRRETTGTATPGYGYAVRYDDNNTNGFDIQTGDAGFSQYGAAWSLPGTGYNSDAYVCGILNLWGGGSNDYPYADWMFYNDVTNTNYNRFAKGGGYQNILAGQTTGVSIAVHTGTDGFDETIGGKFIVLGTPHNKYGAKMEHRNRNYNEDGKQS